MSQDRISDDHLTAERQQQLVVLLDEFEESHKRGDAQTIESFLDRVDDTLRRPLLYDLVRLELELLSGDSQPSMGDYRSRFPDDEATILAALKTRMNEASNAGETTVVFDQHDAKVDLVSGKQPSLVAETAEMLRFRIQALSWMVVVGLSLFFANAILGTGAQLLLLRAATLVIACFCCWRISKARDKKISFWRRYESALVVLVGIQTVSLQSVGMMHPAALGDRTSLNMAMTFAFATWTVAIMSYAIFIPNNWRRATVILYTLASVPLVVTVVIAIIDSRVAELMRMDILFVSALLTYVATGAALYGTITLNSLRRQAFASRRFGQYQLKHRLASGGMGEVYFAQHQLLKRPSAIKLIRPGMDTNEEAITRFESEVQATAKLTHWNTVEIFDYGRTDDGTFYYVMEYLSGMSLQQLVEKHGPMPCARVLFFLRQVCHALEEAHESGLIHQDIKPANIFATKSGCQYDVAKLLDFGLVQEIKETKSGDTTTTRSRHRIVGTPAYMSPEQANGLDSPDVRSDIYSLGATAFFLLTGRPVFSEKNIGEVLRSHIESDPPSFSTCGVDVPTDVDFVIRKCLRKDANDRYPTVIQLREALEKCKAIAEWDAQAAREWWLGKVGST